MFFNYLLWFDRLPEVISTYGGEIDDLIFYVYNLTGIFFVLMEGYLLYIILRYRRKKGEKVSSAKGNTRTEIGTILIAGLVMLCLDMTIEFKGTKTWTQIKEELPENPHLVIRTVAARFSWTFIYPGKDGLLDTADDVTSINELKIPIHKAIQINLRGRDVLHSLFLPAARYKQDVLPGREIKTWLQLNKVGETPVICAELCGAGHTNMGGTLIAMKLDDFNQWHLTESAKAAEDAL